MSPCDWRLYHSVSGRPEYIVNENRLESSPRSLFAAPGLPTGYKQKVKSRGVNDFGKGLNDFGKGEWAAISWF
jgi:hypothetical protein